MTYKNKFKLPEEGGLKVSLYLKKKIKSTKVPKKSNLNPKIQKDFKL